jgi:phage-related protein
MFQVLFYETVGGNEIILDFLRSLPVDDRKTIGEDLKTVQVGYPLGLPLCRPMGDGLMEVRSSLPSKREARLLFSFDGKAQCLVVLHAFIKKTPKTPKPDLDLARKRKNEFYLKGG